MPSHIHADRWGDLEVLDVVPVVVPATSPGANASWGCGRCGDDHPLARGSVVKLRSHLGVADQIVCARCAGIARLRCQGERPTRVLLVDDVVVHRDQVRRRLEAAEVAEIVGYVDDDHEAMHEVERLRPEAVVLDLGAPNVGMELISELPDDLQVVVLSERPELHARCRRLRSNVDVLPRNGDALSELVTLFAA